MLFVAVTAFQGIGWVSAAAADLVRSAYDRLDAIAQTVFRLSWRHVVEFLLVVSYRQLAKPIREVVFATLRLIDWIITSGWNWRERYRRSRNWPGIVRLPMITGKR